jgi:hypothetical protein
MLRLLSTLKLWTTLYFTSKERNNHPGNKWLRFYYFWDKGKRRERQT